MTPQEIKSKAPEGATHYNPRNNDYVVYLGGLIEEWFLIKGEKLRLYPPAFISELKPL